MKNKTSLKNKTLMTSFAFFGSSRFSVIVLDELERQGFMPAFVVTTTDKPVGRKLTMTPNPVKVWAHTRKITVLDPEKLDDDFFKKLQNIQAKKQVATENIPLIDVYIVASYGKIIPFRVLNIPPRHTLNIHPSLLPKYRGASPLQSVILDDEKNTGITIMRIDEKMDHGPIISQENVRVENWPIYKEFEELMAKKGAQLLVKVLPNWVSDGKNRTQKNAQKIQETEQNHTLATYTKKTNKEDGLLDFDVKTLNLVGDPYKNFLKIQAYHEWPQAFFYFKSGNQKIRVKITKASYNSTSNQTSNESPLKIERVIPEGGKEMIYKDFLRGY